MKQEQALIKLAQVRLAINHVLRQRLIKQADAFEREVALHKDPLVRAITAEQYRTGIPSRYPPIVQAQKLRDDWARTGQTPLYTPHKNTRMIPPPIVPKSKPESERQAPVASNYALQPPAKR